MQFFLSTLRQTCSKLSIFRNLCRSLQLNLLDNYGPISYLRQQIRLMEQAPDGLSCKMIQL